MYQTTLSFSDSNPQTKIKIFKKVLPFVQKITTIARVIIS